MLTHNWTPHFLGSSLALWLDAADASTITTVSGAVSQWNDKSGNNRHATQATAANRPTYNATTKAIVSDGSNDIMYLGGTTQALAGTSPFTIFSLNSNTGGIGGRVLLATGTGSTTDFYAHHYYSVAQGGTKWISAWGSANAKSLSSQDADTNVHISVSQYTGTSHTTWVDGVQGTVASFSGSNLNNTNTIFGGDPITGNNMAGSTYEIIICNTAVSTTTIQLVEGYLAWKNNLVSLLPSNHTWKNSPPTNI